jgi:hypothetical protein
LKQEVLTAPRHLQIEQQQIKRLLLDQRQRLGAARRRCDLIAASLKLHPQREPDCLFAIRNQNTGASLQHDTPSTSESDRKLPAPQLPTPVAIKERW